MTTIRANADLKFLLKYLLIGIGCIAFGFWAMYDTFVTSPIKMEKAKVLAKLKLENPDDAVWQQEWKDSAVEHGWFTTSVIEGVEKVIPERRPTETPKDVKYFVVWQYIFMGLGFGIGLPCFLWYVRNKGTWVESDGKGLTSSWGQSLDFKEISSFDKKKWEKKGIGVVTTKNGQRFVIDDLKFSRKEMDSIVRMMESELAPEMIVNGQPEEILPSSAEADVDGSAAAQDEALEE